jgi:hypothetical protein
MKNNANPLTDEETNTINEYPVNQWRNLRPENTDNVSGFVHKVETGAESEPWLLLEASDWGHRHFSSLHWLYPGTFSPSTPRNSKILSAAKNTLQMKVATGGGHTGQVIEFISNLIFRSAGGLRLGSHASGQGSGIDIQPGWLY